jgi:hypothetical protein
MQKVRFHSLLAAASLSFVTHSMAQYADAVAAYAAGAGVGVGYNDPAHALGSPTVFIGYQDSDPFNPPYSGDDLVSVGTAGSLTLKFNSPIQNTPGHAFGLDFIIFANSGFQITNGNYFGGGITDGSLFANNPGDTEVWVSSDDVSYYRLDPTKASVVDGLFPTDSAGDFTRAVNPLLTADDFAGKDMTGIRSLYNGSGGGTGYDIGWAQDGLGQSVFLPSISYVRVDVLSGKSEIDAISAVPEPGTGLLALAGVGLGIWRRRLAK